MECSRSVPLRSVSFYKKDINQDSWILDWWPSPNMFHLVLTIAHVSIHRSFQVPRSQLGIFCCPFECAYDAFQVAWFRGEVDKKIWTSTRTPGIFHLINSASLKNITFAFTNSGWITRPPCTARSPLELRTESCRPRGPGDFDHSAPRPKSGSGSFCFQDSWYDDTLGCWNMIAGKNGETICANIMENENLSCWICCAADLMAVCLNLKQLCHLLSKICLTRSCGVSVSVRERMTPEDCTGVVIALYSMYTALKRPSMDHQHIEDPWDPFVRRSEPMSQGRTGRKLCLPGGGMDTTWWLGDGINICKHNCFRHGKFRWYS